MTSDPVPVDEPYARQRLSHEKTRQKAGYLYVAVHPLWLGWVKVGMTNHPDGRLRMANTWDPLKQFEFVYVELFSDCRRAETFAHRLLSAEFARSGEWFKCDEPSAIEAVMKAKQREDKEITDGKEGGGAG